MIKVKSKEIQSFRIVFAIIFLSVFYAILRYHILGNVEWKDFPIYVLNKGVAMSSVILLLLNFVLEPLKRMDIKLPESFILAKFSMGITGFLLSIIHVFFSLILLSPKYYAKFYLEDGTLSLLGNLSLVGGVFCFIILWLYSLSFENFTKSNLRFVKLFNSGKFIIYAMLFLGFHIIFMGYSVWIEPLNWQGGLPPISLISFLFFALVFIIIMIRGK